MNVKHITLAALIAVSGTTAFAAEGSESPTGASVASRTAVVAQVEQARAAGTLFVPSYAAGNLPVAVASERSRDEVRAEARGARASTAHLYVGA